ncbi:hypothetical protein [Gimesia panareensis]|nr:hypothetical protein [Gimesia panareensis]
MQTQLMPSLFKRVTLTLSFLTFSTLALAQSKTDEPRKEQIDWNKPIAVASIASIDRVLDDIDYMFATIDKPEYPAMIKGFLAQYRNLEGIDKTRPLGAFVFLKEGISPQPEVVGYIPIKDLDALKQTLDEVGFFLNPVPDTKDRFTVALPNFSLHLKLAHDYAFVQIKSEALDRDFYNPDEFTRPLAEKYDIAASLLLKNVPEPMRMMAVDLASARIDQQLQQKPGESDIQFQSRKATTMLIFKQFQSVANDGAALTLGYELSKQNKKILLHFGIEAKPETDLTKQLEELSRKASQYSYLNAADSDVLGYTVFPLNKDIEQKMLLDVIEKSKADVPPVFLGTADNPGPAAKILKSAESTVRSGKLDAHVKLVQNGAEKLALIGALKLTDAASFKAGLQEFFDLMAQAEDTEGIKANVTEVEGVAIHQISPNGVKQNARDIFGENPVIFLGCSDDECWIAMGEPSCLELLQASITAAGKEGKQLKPGSPFLFSLKFTSVLPLAEQKNKDPEFVESAKVAFATGGDLMTFYPKITSNQVSLNLELGEGFIRLISLAIANRK